MKRLRVLWVEDSALLRPALQAIFSENKDVTVFFCRSAELTDGTARPAARDHDVTVIDALSLLANPRALLEGCPAGLREGSGRID
jgi:hypothetical protein